MLPSFFLCFYFDRLLDLFEASITGVKFLNRLFFNETGYHIDENKMEFYWEAHCPGQVLLGRGSGAAALARAGVLEKAQKNERSQYDI